MVQFEYLRQDMINRGANPFVVAYDGTSSFDYNLSYLKNLPRQKSVYFTTRAFPDEFKQQNQFFNPWFYQTGVFDGKFVRVIGEGAEGIVISGEWFGKKAAYKFVEIGAQKFHENMKKILKTLDEKLSEMISIQSIVGSKIFSFY